MSSYQWFGHTNRHVSPAGCRRVRQAWRDKWCKPGLDGPLLGDEWGISHALCTNTYMNQSYHIVSHDIAWGLSPGDIGSA